MEKRKEPTPLFKEQKERIVAALKLASFDVLEKDIQDLVMKEAQRLVMGDETGRDRAIVAKYDASMEKDEEYKSHIQKTDEFAKKNFRDILTRELAALNANFT